MRQSRQSRQSRRSRQSRQSRQYRNLFNGGDPSPSMGHGLAANALKLGGGTMGMRFGGRRQSRQSRRQSRQSRRQSRW